MLLTTIPFAVAAAANIAFLRINVMVLELLKGDVDVGVFSVAYTLFTPFIWIPMILSRTIFPGLTAAYATDRAKARMTTWQWYRLMAIVGIPMALSISLLADPVLSHFPAGYEGSAAVLQILIWALPVCLVVSIGFNVQQIINRERAAARVQLTGALVNAAANFILIPPYGIKGAAVATLIGVVVMEAQIYYDLHRHFLQGKHTIVLFVRPVLGGLVMAAVALALFGVSPWLATGLGLIAYAVTIMATGAIKTSELKALLK
jgi:O-antigen/teichoic acid export membrane protein